MDDETGIVLTRHLAKRIFGSTDPLNQVIRVDEKQVFKVTGVMEDLPDNTEFYFEYLVSLAAGSTVYTDGSVRRKAGGVRWKWA